MFATPENGWLNKAFFASTFFENSNTKAQVTGNFDGAYLTCGYLGWTFLYGDQQRMVKQFAAANPGLISKYMPHTWADYLNACNQLTKRGCEIVRDWSSGANVKEPYRSELAALWNSPEMTAIELAVGQNSFGAFAELMTKKFCDHFICPATLNIFAMFFDIRVQNGSLKDIVIENIPNNRGMMMAQAKVAIKWMYSRAAGAGLGDVHRNASLWEPMLQGSDDWRLALFGVGYLRSIECTEAWKGVCLDRKGSLAFGQGYVNGIHYVLS